MEAMAFRFDVMGKTYAKRSGTYGARALRMSLFFRFSVLARAFYILILFHYYIL